MNVTSEMRRFCLYIITPHKETPTASRRICAFEVSHSRWRVSIPTNRKRHQHQRPHEHMKVNETNNIDKSPVSTWTIPTNHESQPKHKITSKKSRLLLVTGTQTCSQAWARQGHCKLRARLPRRDGSYIYIGPATRRSVERQRAYIRGTE